MNSESIERWLEFLKRDNIRWCIDVIPTFPVSQLDDVCRRIEAKNKLAKTFVLPDKWLCLELTKETTYPELLEFAKIFKYKQDIRLGINRIAVKNK